MANSTSSASEPGPRTPLLDIAPLLRADLQLLHDQVSAAKLHLVLETGRLQLDLANGRLTDLQFLQANQALQAASVQVQRAIDRANALVRTLQGAPTHHVH